MIIDEKTTILRPDRPDAAGRFLMKYHHDHYQNLMGYPI